MFRSLYAALMLLLVPTPIALAQQQAPGIEIVVHATEIKKVTIAIPPFRPASGSRAYKTGALSDVIMNDLEISGYFQNIAEPELGAAQDRQDRSSGSIDFPEWARLKANYVVKGTYHYDGRQISVEVMAYDVGVQRRVVGRQYNGTAREYRRLAHRISDDLVKFLVGEQGIAQTRILFISSRTGARELWIMDVDGANQHALTHDNAVVQSLCWGMNNTEAYFTSTKDYNPDLCGIFIDGSQSWFISRRPGLNLSPDWNPRTGKIVLTLSKDGNSEIYTMDRNGRNARRLTYTRAIDSSPCWSPDGSQIVFTSDRRAGAPQLWIMDAQGFGQQLLTRQGRYNDSADFSPDGRRIAFTSRVNGQFDIFVMDADGTNWRRLTQNPANDEDPSWTRDGQHIVFCSNRTGKKQIFIMNADGSNVRQLTFKGENLSPAAEPPEG